MILSIGIPAGNEQIRLRDLVFEPVIPRLLPVIMVGLDEERVVDHVVAEYGVYIGYFVVAPGFAELDVKYFFVLVGEREVGVVYPRVV
jgi:hypothetical protein